MISILDTPCLLNSYQLSSVIKLKNRIVMAPMTRRQANANHSPTELMATYYAKRADAGLIITEGTIISEDAIGYGNVPGIYTQEQINAWRKITAAVHAVDGLIFLQLWHCGRVSHPNFHNGQLPISASATVMNSPLGNSGFICEQSRAATPNDIQSLIADYAQAAKNAIIAGFDGIEIHGANGYLIDQFLHYCSNHRNDEYGGTPKNMARFCLDVVHACAEVIDIERVGLRLSPGGHMAEIITDPRDKWVFSYLLDQLSALTIAYVHIGNFDDLAIYPELENKTMTDFVRSKFHGTLIAAGGYNYQSACTGIKDHRFDLIAFGRPFIANPDLIKRISDGAPWITYEPTMLSSL